VNEFIISFRECLEACLIVGIIYTLLEKNNLKKELRQLWLGVISAIAASAVVAISLNNIKDSLGNASSHALFEAVSMYITAILLWYVIFWLSKHVSHKSGMESKTKAAVASAGWGIFLVVFFAILREGFETALFLMGSFSMTGTFSYLGFFGGMALANRNFFLFRLFWRDGSSNFNWLWNRSSRPKNKSKIIFPRDNTYVGSICIWNGCLRNS